MTRSSRADIAALNHIAAILIDVRRLYSRAAMLAAEDTEAVGLLERTLGERTMLLTRIQQRVVKLAGSPRTDGSLAGSFLDVRAVFERDANVALEHVERGERTLRDEIRKSMRRDDVSAETRAFLGLALDAIVSGEMRVEEREEEAAQEARPY